MSAERKRAELEAKKYLEDFEHIRLNIAVTGDCGSGKSTFVNAFRGMKDSDDGAAPTGVVETTMELKTYPHPIYRNVILWDLPGIGTTKFPADQYMEKVKFETYDLFIIVSAGRFRENDAKLAQEIKKMGKKFYFVRSKIDQDLRNEQRSQKEYSEEKTLQEIRESCIKGLEEQGVTCPHVFLVSSVDLSLYDSPALQETIERELPSIKRDVLILAYPNVSSSIITKKKEVFSSQIKYYALLAAGVAAVPIPGLSFAADSRILEGVLNSYLHGFHLDVKSMEELSRARNVPLDDLRAGLSRYSGKEVSQNLVLSKLRREPTINLTDKPSQFITICDVVLTATMAFLAITNYLHDMLDSLSDDAQNVQRKAFNSNGYKM